MPGYSTTYYSRLYADFRSIAPDDHSSIVRFFEYRAERIKQLDAEEYFDMLVSYTDALFHSGMYAKHIQHVDAVIETAFELNIRYYRGEEVLESQIFRKASSHYNLLQYDKAVGILRQLVRINPYDPLHIRFLRRCLTMATPGWLLHLRAASIFIFLTAVLSIAVEMLIVRHYFPDYTAAAMAFRNILFGLGVLCLAGGEVWHRLNAIRRAANVKNSAFTRRD